MSGLSFLLTTTQAYSFGGVQAYSRRMLEILSAFAVGRDAELDCISLLDASCRIEDHANPVRCRKFYGAGGSKAGFTTACFRLAFGHRPAASVVMHTGIAPVSLALRRAGLSGPYVLVLHGVEAWKRLGYLERTAARNAARIVATTRHTATRFAAANDLATERVSVIPLALEDSEAADQPLLAAREGELRVVTVGRLAAEDSYKGYDTLIQAVHHAGQRGANVRLDVVGTGDDRPRLERLATGLGLNDRVRFQGSLPEPDLRSTLIASDVFALPSRGEGFGLVYVEAMRFGKPCIAGRHGGPPEIISDGNDGYLVEHGDVEQLSSRLVTLCQNAELRTTLGRRALQKVRERYLFPVMRQRWFELLEQI